jgi:chromate reductase, NAD(P)H dehydrogenase (quinone)
LRDRNGVPGATVKNVRLLAISGSLRARSSNTEVLRALALLAPPHVIVRQFEGLAALPAFNPDLDEEGMTPPPPVQELRSHVASADGIVICSPEYAHGVPGSLKNALDWLVSDPSVIHKPTALVNVSPRSGHAQASLAETLRTMSMHLVGENTSWLIPLADRGMTSTSMALDPALAALLRDCLAALVVAVGHYREGSLLPAGG